MNPYLDGWTVDRIGSYVKITLSIRALYLFRFGQNIHIPARPIAFFMLLLAFTDVAIF